jgi:hypothetical protein
MKFDVHHAGTIGGNPIGAFMHTIEAATHREARDRATEANAGVSVIVLPHRPPSEKLERALRQLERGAARPRQSTWRHRRGGER